jgi:5,10-methylenetetrahydromethanopterin reductase
MSLTLAADVAHRPRPGCVLLPRLRHPMTNAAANAALAGLTPGRIAV